MLDMAKESGETSSLGLSTEISPSISSGKSEIPKTENLHKQFYEAVNTTFHKKPAEMSAAFWAGTFLIPHFSVLERQYVELGDGISLLVVRNRIDYLEHLFMVQDCSMSDLLSDLKLSDIDVEKVTIAIMKKIEKHTNIGISELSNVIAQELLQKTQKMSVAGTQTTNPSMSKSISVKASIHYFRWKHAFKFPAHSGISKIKAHLDSLKINYEDFFIEVANLFTVTSAAGVHLCLIPNFKVKSIKRSLKVYSMDQPITVGVVESLYCSLPGL